MDGHSNKGNDEIIVPKKSNKNQKPAVEAAELVDRRKNPIVAILICAIALVVCLAIVFALNSTKKPETNNDLDDTTAEDENVEVETVYTTPEGSEDAQADYTNWLDQQKQSAKTTDEVFDADMQIVSNEISLENYSKALELLDAINRDELTRDQLFRLYNIYSRVYEANGDTAKYDEYTSLRTEQLNFLMDEEEE